MIIEERALETEFESTQLGTVKIIFAMIEMIPKTSGEMKEKKQQ